MAALGLSTHHRVSSLSIKPSHYTHKHILQGQQVFHLLQPLDLQPGDRVEGTVEMVRQKDNPRLYEVGRQDRIGLPLRTCFFLI